MVPIMNPFIRTHRRCRLNGEDHNTCIANNMGIIHFHVRHYAMAARFFQHALLFDQTAADAALANHTGTGTGTGADSVPVHAVGATRRLEVLYNLGVAMLHLQRPREAFECLLVPLGYYHSNPRIWLRLAEACIMVHTLAERQRAERRPGGTGALVSSVVGSGPHRKFVVQPTPMKYVR